MIENEDNESRTAADYAEDEVERGERELQTGTVAEGSYEELLKRVNAERGK